MLLHRWPNWEDSLLESDLLFNGICLLCFALLLMGATMSLLSAILAIMFGDLIGKGEKVVLHHLGLGCKSCDPPLSPLFP